MRILTFLSLILVLSSCWPSSISFRENSMPEEWQTFFVVPLELNSATAPISYNAVLTEAVRSGVQNNTRLKMVGNVDLSNVTISGEITNYATSPIALKEGDNASQNRLTINVDFTIKTPSKGLELIQLKASRFFDYSSDKNLADVEQDLIIEINKQLVQDVINKLLSNW